MKIEILEETGVKTEKYGHMRHGETREVDDHDGAFFCANGWAKDVDGSIPTGERGSLDHMNPDEWDGTETAKKSQIRPAKATHKKA